MFRQACLEGLLDPAKARPFDRRWWRKVRSTLDWLEQRNRARLLELQHQLHVGALTYETDRRTFNLHWDQAEALRDHLQGIWLPWIDTHAGRRGAIKNLGALWAGLWGDVNDPATTEKVNRTREALHRRAAQYREQSRAENQRGTQRARRNRP